MLKVKRIGLIITKEEKRFAIKLAGIEGMFSHPSLIHRLIRHSALAHGLGPPEPSLSNGHTGESNE